MQCYGENITFDDKNGSKKKMMNEDLSNADIFSFIYFISCELLFSLCFCKMVLYIRNINNNRFWDEQCILQNNKMSQLFSVCLPISSKV